MELLVKVGDKRYQAEANYAQGFCDGHIISMRPDGYYKSNHLINMKSMCVIRFPVDYWGLRGSTDWKSTKQSVLDLKKYTYPTDSNGKYPWEFGYIQDEKGLRVRDWFIDFQYLLDKGLITKNNYSALYNFEQTSDVLNIGSDFRTLLFHEEAKSRIKPFIKNMAVTSGTRTIGAAGDIPDLDALAADIGDPLTGNLSYEHLNEETFITGIIIIDTDTAGFLLKLTAQSGAEHDGSAYGNGARINFGTFDRIDFEETTGGTLDDIEISKLAFDVSGNGNLGIRLQDGGDSGELLANRLLVKGDSNATSGIVLGAQAESKVINCVVYSMGTSGIQIIGGFGTGKNQTVLNCTVAKNGTGINQTAATGNNNIVIKNNLGQGNTTDYVDAGAGFDTTNWNTSEDATAPGTNAQASVNAHDGTSSFVDYAGNDFRLIVGGDDNATLDNGENLFGAGVTEDIAGQARDNGTPFWIGASHLAAVVGGLFKLAGEGGLAGQGSQIVGPGGLA